MAPPGEIIRVQTEALAPPNNAAAPEENFAIAYERRLPEIQEVPIDKLVFPNVEILNVVATILGALPEIRNIPRTPDQRFELDHALVDALEDYVKALNEAHTRYVFGSKVSDETAKLDEAARALREVLRSDAMALAKRELIEPKFLHQYKGRTGFRHVAFELGGWATVLKDAWPRIAGKTAVTREQITQAKLLSQRLASAAGEHENKLADTPAAATIRHQALTLTMRTYDRVKREATYLRWHDRDADKIMPSLWGKRPRKKPRLQQPAGTAPTESDGAVAPGTAMTTDSAMGTAGAAPPWTSSGES